LSRPSIGVLVLGLCVTAALTAGARISYNHNEARLAALQTKLTGSLLTEAVDVQDARLERIAGTTAASLDPVATYNSLAKSSLAPRGPYASESLAVVTKDGVTFVAHLGAPTIRNVNDPAVIALVRRAATSNALLTTRVVGQRVQRLGYLVSNKGPTGTYVITAAQELPVGRRIPVPSNSPDANLNFAIYFGRNASSANLVETNAALPITGAVSRVTVPFGTNSLTFIAAPRTPLSGALSQYLPWIVLGLGILFSLLAAAITEQLVRRRKTAEVRAAISRSMYEEQYDVAKTLQVALLPKALPNVAHLDLAARYIPSAQRTQIGGDWYSMIANDADSAFFVVGDVSGHGVEAAGYMAALRYSVRTLARLRYSPSEILARANDEIDLDADGHFATALVGYVDTRRRELTIASAGHIPPLVVRGALADTLDVPVNPPLGIGRQPFTETTVAFEPGSTLLAFTDGLVERRGEGIRRSLDRLAAIATNETTSSEELVTKIVGSLDRARNEDDVAVLAIRFLDD
jgi:serine phosphatase RsbU (regulator of sigma subunit)